jgi:hypothetical protein
MDASFTPFTLSAAGFSAHPGPAPSLNPPVASADSVGLADAHHQGAHGHTLTAWAMCIVA